MIRAAMIINGIIIGGFLTLVGRIDFHPIWKMTIHPFFRGAVVAAFVHLDFVIYSWGNQPLFWKSIFFAAIFGGVVDLLATQTFVKGKVLGEGITK